MSRNKANLLRFVTEFRHEPFGHRTGIVQKAVEIRDDPHTPLEISVALAKEVDWLNINMPSPAKFTKSTRSNSAEIAISWVKGNSTDHVNCLRRIDKLLTGMGIATTCLRTAKPGFVVYEDDCQVVAQPFPATPT